MISLQELDSHCMDRMSMDVDIVLDQTRMVDQRSLSIWIEKTHMSLSIIKTYVIVCASGKKVEEFLMVTKA